MVTHLAAGVLEPSTPNALSMSGGPPPTGPPCDRTGPPLPLLLVCRGAVNLRLLQPLTTDPRLELFMAPALTPQWMSLANRVSAIVVAALEDPMAALVYVLSARVKAPIVVVTGHALSEKKNGPRGCRSAPMSFASARSGRR